VKGTADVVPEALPYVAAVPVQVGILFAAKEEVK